MKNKIDNFDKMFYDYFDNNKEVPERIHQTIYTAFDRRRYKKRIKQIIFITLIISLLSLLFIYYLK